MFLLDGTIVNVAIPQMERGLNTTFDNILWVLNGYILVYAVLLITTARLGDMFGPRRLFLIGLVVFTASSLACGLSTSATELIVFRLMQGVGGALLSPQTLSIITNIFPPERRGVAFGLWGAVAGISATIGPILGGFLTTNYDWQAVFFVNVPVGVITVALVWFLMPEVRSDSRHNLDLPGVLLVSGGLFMGIYALIEGQKYTWGPIAGSAFSIGATRWSVLSIYSLLVYSVVVLALFVVWELRAAEPLLPLSLFGVRNFSLGNAIYGLLGIAIFPIFTPLSIFLQSALGFTALHTGLTVVPISIGVLVASPIAGKLADRGFGKWEMVAGLVTFGIGVTLVRQVLAVDDTSWTLTLPFLITGLGMGFVFAPLTTLVMTGVSPEQAGSASGFLNTLQQAGGALGASVVGAILAQETANDLVPQARRYVASVPAHYRGSFMANWQSASHSAQQFGAGDSGGVHLPAGVSAAVARHLEQIDYAIFSNALLHGAKAGLLLGMAGALVAAITASMMVRHTAIVAIEEYQEEDLPEPIAIGAR
jgi:EmrB/QacA subfamily drug resistance transporter